MPYNLIFGRRLRCTLRGTHKATLHIITYQSTTGANMGWSHCHASQSTGGQHSLSKQSKHVCILCTYEVCFHIANTIVHLCVTMEARKQVTKKNLYTKRGKTTTNVNKDSSGIRCSGKCNGYNISHKSVQGACILRCDTMSSTGRCTLVAIADVAHVHALTPGGYTQIPVYTSLL